MSPSLHRDLQDQGTLDDKFTKLHDWDDDRYVFVESDVPESQGAESEGQSDGDVHCTPDLENCVQVVCPSSPPSGHLQTNSSGVETPWAKSITPLLGQPRHGCYTAQDSPSVPSKLAWFKSATPSNSQKPTPQMKASWYTLRSCAPTVSAVMNSFSNYGLQNVIHQHVYYSNEKDLPLGGTERAGGISVCHSTNQVATLQQFEAPLPPNCDAVVRSSNRCNYSPKRSQHWSAQTVAPTVPQISEWLHEQSKQLSNRTLESNERCNLRRVDTVTRLHGVSQIDRCSLQKSSSRSEAHSIDSKVASDHLTIFSLEVITAFPTCL